MEKVRIEKRPGEVVEFLVIKPDEPCPICGSLDKDFVWASLNRGHARRHCCGIELLILNRSANENDSEEFKEFVNNIGIKHLVVINKEKKEFKNE